MKHINIGDKLIGDGCPCFIIAEAGVNHNGSIHLAKKLIDNAKDVGADAVKFQTFKTEAIVTKSAPKAEYQEKSNDEIISSQYDMIKKLELSTDEFRELSKYADDKEIIFLSSPFDEESLDLLDEIGVPAFKLGSGEITNLPLIKYLITKEKPLILSTGMASLCEIEEAINIIKNKNIDLILMYCVTNYPASMDEIDLNIMATLRNTFTLPVGFSDHTMGIELAVAAVALGACIIEKHFTLDRNLEGPDHKASLEPDELKFMVDYIRNVEKGMGSGVKKITNDELSIKKIARKSIMARRDIEKGEIIRKDMLIIKRPETGIYPKYIDLIVGKEINTAVKKDEPIKWDNLK
ncbi:MAG: N-acetylneuraminate synthase [Methanobacterium sp.]